MNLRYFTISVTADLNVEVATGLVLALGFHVGICLTLDNIFECCQLLAAQHSYIHQPPPRPVHTTYLSKSQDPDKAHHGFPKEISPREIMEETAGGMCDMPCCSEQLQEGGAKRDAIQTLCSTATSDDDTCVAEMLHDEKNTASAALHTQAML